MPNWLLCACALLKGQCGMLSKQYFVSGSTSLQMPALQGM